MSESSSLPSPRPTPQRMPRMTCGACDMDSMPPASAISIRQAGSSAPPTRRTASRAAKAVDGKRRSLDGHAGFEPHMARTIEWSRLRSAARCRRQRDRFLLGSTPERCIASWRRWRQIHGGKVAKLSAVAAHRRTGAVDDCDIYTLCHERNLYEEFGTRGKPLSLTRALERCPGRRSR